MHGHLKVTQQKSSVVPLGSFKGWGFEDIKRSITVHETFRSFSSASHQSPLPTPEFSKTKPSQSTSPVVWKATRVVPVPTDYSKVLKSSSVKGLKQSIVV